MDSWVMNIIDFLVDFVRIPQNQLGEEQEQQEQQEQEQQEELSSPFKTKKGEFVCCMFTCFGLLRLGSSVSFRTLVPKFSETTGFVTTRMTTSAPPLIASIDQGTQSTRFFLFSPTGKKLCSASVPLKNYYPQPDRVEQNPLEIYETVKQAAKECLEKAKKDHQLQPSQIKCLGITNQRETTVVWSKKTGKPLHNAIVWSDARADSICSDLISKFGSRDYFRERCGLPIASYFSAMKLKWLFENSENVQKAIQEDDCLFGTVDSWILYNLSGGKVHVTDTTNASRTMLMNLDTLAWDSSLLTELGVPNSILPKIVNTCEKIFPVPGGELGEEMEGVMVGGVVGDQQGAMLGQGCVSTGSMKNTYGTGSFCLMACGEKPLACASGMLSTVTFSCDKKLLQKQNQQEKQENEEQNDRYCMYAIEGSVASAGSALSWAVNNMQMASSPVELDQIASTVEDTSGMYFVPAFTGLLAPHWEGGARACAVGISHDITKAHFLRSLIEASAYQTFEMIEAIQKDTKQKIEILRTDGGMTDSNLLLQHQANLLGVPVARPEEKEATGLGAAIAAGLACDLIEFDDIPDLNKAKKVFSPSFTEEEKEKKLEGWRKAVKRSVGWVEE